MAFLFKRDKSGPAPVVHPLQASIPPIQDAEFNAFYYGQRKGGDFYDFMRVDNGRILFGLLDVAGPLEEDGAVVCAVQDSFRKDGTELFVGEDINESEAMIELGIRINRSDS